MTTPQPLAAIPFGQMLDLIGAKTPAPGGGAVACAAGAMAAALARMVVAYSLGKKSLAQHQDQLQRADAQLGRAREILLELAEEDARAYTMVNELMKLKPEDERRIREWLPAIRTSTQIPLAAIAACVDLLRLMASLAPITNTMLHSDLGIAAVLADAAARSSWWNVKVNAASLPPEERGRSMTQAEGMLASARELRESVERACGG